MLQGDMKVYISCEGRQLPEYQVEVVDAQSVACYIPSKAGKTFTIHWQGRARPDDEHVTTVLPCIDGHLFGGKHYHPGSPFSGFRDAVGTSMNEERPYVFAMLATTDDDGDSPGAKEFPDPGTIEVHFAHIIECRKVSRRFPLDCDASRAVHERSKKLGAHCVSFGEARPSKQKAAKTKVSKLVDKDKPYYMRFIFRYRPEDLLRAQGIVPSDVPPVEASGRKRQAGRDPSEAGPSRKRAKTAAVEQTQHVDAPEEDADALEAELKAIQARSRAIEAKLQARAGAGRSRPPRFPVKGEDQEGEGVKRERSPIRLRSATSGQVIDLTLD